MDILLVGNWDRTFLNSHYTARFVLFPGSGSVLRSLCQERRDVVK